jgi:hypothetical protein
MTSPGTVRQQVPVLYLASSAPDAPRGRLVGVRRYGRNASDHGRLRRAAVRDRGRMRSRRPATARCV